MPPDTTEKFASLPSQTVAATGCEVMDGGTGVIVKDNVLLCVTAPATPVTVTLYVAGASVLVLFNVTVVLLPGVSGLGVKLTVVPAGLPAAVRLIGVENPPEAVVPSVIDAVAVPQVTLAGATVLKV